MNKYIHNNIASKRKDRNNLDVHQWGTAYPNKDKSMLQVVGGGIRAIYQEKVQRYLLIQKSVSDDRSTPVVKYHVPYDPANIKPEICL